MDRPLSDFERVLHKALNDVGYAYRVMTSPEEALRELKIEVTPAKLDALAACVSPLSEAYTQFGGEGVRIG
jgi:hypothetical protein